MTIRWELDRQQAEDLAAWLEYLEDVTDPAPGDDDDTDHEMIMALRNELLALLKQDDLANPKAEQPHLLRVENPS